MPPAHPLACRDKVRIRDLLEHPFISRGQGSGTREVISEYLRAAGLDLGDLDTCMELGDPMTLKGAVEAGIGLSILSGATLIKELRLGVLAAVPLDPPMKRRFSFVRQRQKFRVRFTDELLNFAHHYYKAH